MKIIHLKNLVLEQYVFYDPVFASKCIFLCLYLHGCIYVYSNKNSYGSIHISVLPSGRKVKDNKGRTLTLFSLYTPVLIEFFNDNLQLL